MPARIGFLIDPLEGLHVGHDTTFALMLECQRRGHEVRAFEQPHLSFAGGQSAARMRTVQLRPDPRDHFTVLKDELAPLAELDAIFLRKDPPVDAEFVHATQLVELTGPKPPLFFNHPAALRNTSEKLFALAYPDLVPRTVVSRDLLALRAFVGEFPEGAIVKPLDGFGGQGILHCRREDRNVASLLELATRAGRDHVVAQEYLPASRDGDKRVLVVDGEPLGAVLRVPRDDETRANMAVGGKPVRAAIDEADRRICARLAPELRRRGLWFVGIDVIGGKLIEVNVTSPTGICEVDALDGSSIERDVIDLMEKKLAER